VNRGPECPPGAAAPSRFPIRGKRVHDRPDRLADRPRPASVFFALRGIQCRFPRRPGEHEGNAWRRSGHPGSRVSGPAATGRGREMGSRTRWFVGRVADRPHPPPPGTVAAPGETLKREVDGRGRKPVSVLRNRDLGGGHPFAKPRRGGEKGKGSRWTRTAGVSERTPVVPDPFGAGREQSVCGCSRHRNERRRRSSGPFPSQGAVGSGDRRRRSRSGSSRRAPIGEPARERARLRQRQTVVLRDVVRPERRRFGLKDATRAAVRGLIRTDRDADGVPCSFVIVFVVDGRIHAPPASRAPWPVMPGIGPIGRVHLYGTRPGTGRPRRRAPSPNGHAGKCLPVPVVECLSTLPSPALGTGRTFQATSGRRIPRVRICSVGTAVVHSARRRRPGFPVWSMPMRHRRRDLFAPGRDPAAEDEGPRSRQFASPQPGDDRRRFPRRRNGRAPRFRRGGVWARGPRR